MSTTETESRKNEIAARLVELAREESQLLIDRPLDLPEITWMQYMKRIDGIDGERRELPPGSIMSRTDASLLWHQARAVRN